MKLFLENIAYASRIIVVKEEFFAFNEFPFHHHPEYEMILILKGNGKRFVGDDIGEFNAGELYFLGPDLPHTFYNKHLPDNREIHQIVVQFRGDFLGKDFFEKQPFKQINAFLSNSTRGYLFKGEALQKATATLKDLLELDETGIIIRFLDLLDMLSRTTDFELLSASGFSKKVDVDASERMNRVYEYVLNNFEEDIPLTRIADIACLSPESFCRYFKKHTRKTFSAFVTEIRVGHACKLLQENRMDVNQISANAGFNNISYFNRKFKALTGKTPLEYKKAFTKTA